MKLLTTHYKLQTKSFTLIEILVTATIIGLLSSIASVSYSQFMKQSRDAKRKADLEQVRSALEMFRSNPSLTAYPTPCAATCSNMGLRFATGGITGGGYTYVEKLPQDPLSSRQYYYTGSINNYTLGSWIEGSPGTGTTCGDCDVSGSSACNYCLGPYGVK